MRIVLLTETFSKNMGYLENCLPRYLAGLGADVHVVSMDLPPYYQLADFKETKDLSSGSQIISTGTIEEIEGFTLHVLPHKKLLGYMRIVGLYEKLQTLRPDIVQTTVAIGWIPLDAAIFKVSLGYKLFTGNHNAASTFPMAKRKFYPWDREYLRSVFTRALPGRMTSLFTEKCYAVTVDCAEIAWQFFGVQKEKVEVMHLGVDTDVFFPVRTDEHGRDRQRIRAELGLGSTDVICIYTGKLTQGKNALILAHAVGRLRSMGMPYFGLFIGEGGQRVAIEESAFCRVLPFMPFRELAPYYRASDIAVWPTNESTSMLDAAACGIPIVISDGIVYRDHVDGNGIVYKMNDLEDLVRTLIKLCDSEERQHLGGIGAKKMAQKFNWESVAARRFRDFEQSLRLGKG